MNNKKLKKKGGKSMSLKERIDAQSRKDLLFTGMNDNFILPSELTKKIRKEFEVWNKNGENVWRRLKLPCL